MNDTHTHESLAAEIEAYARTWPQKAPLSDALYGYAAAVRTLAQSERQEPTTERPQQWEFCHVRRPSAHEFAEAIGRMRNDGWEFDTQPIASPSADGDRLWLAFLRRPISRAVAAPDAEPLTPNTQLAVFRRKVEACETLVTEIAGYRDASFGNGNDFTGRAYEICLNALAAALELPTGNEVTP